MERRVTTQDISWFLDLHRNNQLNLDPPYQRRSIWSPKDRRFFLDTIFRWYPSPAIFLQRVPKNNIQVHEVVDGKQRLETILRFVDNKIAIGKDYGNLLLNGKKWKHLDPEMQQRFWDYVLPVEFIRFTDENAVNDAFDRLNRNSTKLEHQELRHAHNDGWFIKFAEKESDEPFWEDIRVSTVAQAKRMKDVQIISELLMIMIRKKIDGFDQKLIDKVTSDYEEPTETDPDFDTASFAKEVAAMKILIQDIERHGKPVVTHASSLMHLYSLWAVLYLNRENLPSATAIAKRYDAFMKDYKKLKEVESPDAASLGWTIEQFTNAYRYYVNATGASTELKQRQERYEIVKKVILGVE